MIRCALIGVSGFGAVHYADLMRERAAGRAEIVGATIINQEQEREKCAALRAIGCRIYEDYREMLNDLRGKIDLCFIPTGIAFHLPMTIAALEAGANVYVEKPVTATIQEARAMREAELRSGKFVAVGYQSIYQPETRWIKEAVLAGRIGQLKTLKCYGLWPRDDSYYHRNNWAGKLRAGGNWVLDCPFTNALAHYLNLLLFHAGNSFGASAEIASLQTVLYRANPIETNDVANVQLKTVDGKDIFFYFTHVSEENSGPFSVLEGTLGRIEYDLSRVVIELKSGERECFDCSGETELRVHVFDALAARLKGDTDRFICTVESAAKHTLVCNAIFDFADTAVVPADAVRVVKNAEGVCRRIVPGIDRVIRRAFEENRLPGPEDFPWMKRSPVFSLENYHDFSGEKYLSGNI